MIYLTHYTEYPIYEPAEGGYYYAGQEAGNYYECDTKEEAIQQLAEMREELEEEGFEVYDERAVLRRKYIGDGESWIIEEELGQHECGWHPYE